MTTSPAFKQRQQALVQAVNTSGLSHIVLNVDTNFNERNKSFDFAMDKDKAVLTIKAKYNLAQVLNKFVAKTNYRVVANAGSGFVLARIAKVTQQAA